MPTSYADQVQNYLAWRMEENKKIIGSVEIYAGEKSSILTQVQNSLEFGHYDQAKNVEANNLAGFNALSKLYAAVVPNPNKIMQTPRDTILNNATRTDGFSYTSSMQKPRGTLLDKAPSTDVLKHLSNTFLGAPGYDAAEVVSCSAIALACLYAHIEIRELSLSDDPEEKRLQEIAAMATLREFIGTASAAVNNMLDGRANPEKSFLEDDGVGDTGYAKDVYAKARDLFETHCHKLNLDSQELKEQFNHTISPKVLAFMAPAERMVQPDFMQKDLLEQNLTYMEFHENLRAIRGQQNDFPDDFNYATKDTLNRLAQANKALLAAKAARDGVSLLADGFTDAYRQDLETIHNGGIVKVDPPKEPKKPSAWVRVWNRFGFYPETMAAYARDLEAYKEACDRHAFYNDFIQDASERALDATQEAKEGKSQRQIAAETAREMDLDAAQVARETGTQGMTLNQLTQETYGERDVHHAAPARAAENAAQRPLDRDVPGLHR